MSLGIITTLVALAIVISLLSRNPTQSEMDNEARMTEQNRAQQDMARAEAEAKRHHREEMLRQAQLRKAQTDSRRDASVPPPEFS